MFFCTPKLTWTDSGKPVSSVLKDYRQAWCAVCHPCLHTVNTLLPHGSMLTCETLQQWPEWCSWQLRWRTEFWPWTIALWWPPFSTTTLWFVFIVWTKDQEAAMHDDAYPRGTQTFLQYIVIGSLMRPGVNAVSTYHCPERQHVC